jgi:hypothetical protein
MNRRRFTFTAVGSLLSVFVLSVMPPLLAAPLEPTYTVTLPDKQVINLRIENIKTPDGRRRMRVWNQPKSAAKSDLYIDTSMILEADGKPSASRLYFGANADQGMSLEAVRKGNGYGVREPELSGDLQFGAPLFVPLIAELFVGKQYDFKRGGPQTFAHLLDANVSTARISTLTLTAEGTPETIELPDGPVKARKLRYLLNDLALPEPARAGVFYVGANGEVLKCDTPFFGVPLRAKGPARWEDGGRRFVLNFKNQDSGNRVVTLQADRQLSGDWAIKLTLADMSDALATLTCDKSFRLKKMETPWHGRPFTAAVVGTDTVHWTIKGGPEQQTPVSNESPVWFMPHWFFTDLWEGTGGAFANMNVDDTRDGQLLALFLGQRDAAVFTLERLKDSPSVQRNGASIPLRHYRFYTGGKQAAVEARATPIYDFYTDGSRLIIFLTSDNIKIVRTGWEMYATALPLPKREETAPAAKPEVTVDP